MQLRNTIVFLLFYLFPFIIYGQAIDNTLSFKNINNDNYVRISFEDDFFSGTDYYYTGGINVEYVAPWVRKFPLSKLLLHPKYSYIRYGLGLESDLYTPTNIGKEEILFDDRPYAACTLLKTFLIAVDVNNKQRFSTTLSMGVIGPLAGAMDVQTTVHPALPDNTIPEGWSNQVRNDVILNYQVDYEKQLLSAARFFSLDADGMGRIGTLSDKAGVGITTMAGYFDSPFGNLTSARKNFRIYVYDHPEIDVIGYDATIEGGVFDHGSPYIISPGNISRFTFQNRYGLVMGINRIYLEYFRTFLSSEFNTGLSHSWGGLQIAVGF